jgi:hypothetical protein
MDRFRRIVSEPVEGFFDKVLQFLPNLLTAVLILLFGLLAGWLTRLVLTRFFTVVKLDGFSERSGLKLMLSRGGLSVPLSALLSRTIGGLVVFVFLLISLDSLNLDIIRSLIEKLFGYLPNIFVAVVIVFLGGMAGNFLGRAALIASVNTGMRMSGMIGRLVKYLVYFLSITMAVEQLGIGKETVLLAFAILFSGIVLALAIAFGLGGQTVAREYLEKKLRERPADDDIQHL